MAGEHILIIEDDEGLVELLEMILRPLDYRLSIATEGRKGLELALKEKPDLLLVDLNLPDISGIEVLERLQEHTPQIPAILITAYGSETIAARALRLGVRDYLTKPFKVDDLVKAIEQAIEASQLRRERERLVTELNRANRQLERRMRELATFQVIGRMMAALTGIDRLLRRVVNAATYLTGARAAAAFLPDKRHGTCYLEAMREGGRSQGGLHLPGQDRYAQQVLQTGEAIWTANFRRAESFIAHLENEVRVLGYVPIKLGDETIGVLGVALTQDQTDIVEAAEWRLRVLADQVAIALRNAQLYESIQRQAHQLRTLNRIARMVTSSLELDEVMRAVVKSINQILRVETGSLVLLDEETHELIFRITLHEDTEEMAPFRLKVGQGIVGWVVKTGKPARVNDVSKDPRFYAAVDQARGFHTRSVLCVPLILQKKVIGAIEVINKIDETQPEGVGEFTEEDEALLSAVAAFVAMAVENARLHEATRNRVAAEMLHQTVVTLSHYINNPLQVLLGVARTLRHRRRDDDLATVIEQEVQRINGAIDALQTLTSPHSVAYLGNTPMVDISHLLDTHTTDPSISGSSVAS